MGFAKTWNIRCNDAMTLAEPINLVQPHLLIERKSVDQEENRPLPLIDKAQTAIPQFQVHG